MLYAKKANNYPRKRSKHITKDTEQRFEDLLEKLNQKKEDGCAILVHAECPKKFTDKRKSTQIERPIKKLRSSMDQKFEWKNHCFLCGETVDCHHPDRESFSKVMTLELRTICCSVLKEETICGDKMLKIVFKVVTTWWQKKPFTTLHVCLDSNSIRELTKTLEGQ